MFKLIIIILSIILSQIVLGDPNELRRHAVIHLDFHYLTKYSSMRIQSTLNE